MTIYQVLLRLWRNGKFSGFDTEAFDYLKTLGVSHVWYTGVVRHATGKAFVKGDAGSPYAISDYYDVNPYLADNEQERMAEFESLVKRTHEAGLKVITDLVPNHVACDYDRSALPLHDYCDYDWTDTLKINYQAPGAWDKMYDIVHFWASKGVDGMRCDMAELVPPEFLKWLFARIKQEFPQFIFIGEVYNKGEYGRNIYDVGFDFLYDKSGLYDVLMNVVKFGHSARNITWNWQSLGEMQPFMLNFLENHDEVRFASPSFGGSASRTFAPLAASALFNTCPFMIYFGEEIGVDAHESGNDRTTIFNFGHVKVMDGIDESNQAFLDKFRSIMQLAASPVCTEGQSFDLCYNNTDSQGFDQDRHFVFLRHYGKETVLVFCNFGSADADVTVRIPDLACELFGLSRQDLPESVVLNVPAYDGKFLYL